MQADVRLIEIYNFKGHKIFFSFSFLKNLIESQVSGNCSVPSVKSENVHAQSRHEDQEEENWDE